MSSPAKGTGLLASASSAVQLNRFVRRGYDPRRAQPGASSERLR